MDTELTAFIIEQLSNHYDRNNIIHAVCIRGRLNWKDAERLVDLVEAQHGRSIAKRQTPLLLFISIGTLFVGIGLLAMNLLPLLGFFQRDVMGQILSLHSGYYQILGAITGVGMTAGGLIGLWRAMGAIFPD